MNAIGSAMFLWWFDRYKRRILMDPSDLHLYRVKKEIVSSSSPQSPPGKYPQLECER